MYMNEDLDQKKIILLMIVFIFFIIIAIVLYQMSYGKKYDQVKIDPNQNYVYKREGSYSSSLKHLPYINVQGSAAEAFNQEIEALEGFASLPNNRVGFVFNKSGNILAVSIKLVNYYTEDERPETFFKTYLLNLDTKKAYTRNEIYQDYGIDEKDISNSIQDGFQKMYEDVVKEKYVDPNECDYACFLEWRGVDDYSKGAELYIENNTLIVFRGFQTESVFGEENYFKRKHFKFEVQK